MSIVLCKNKFYEKGFCQAKRVSVPVISIGNIVAGGTGKTPFVHFLSTQLKSHRIAILSRGYGQIPDEALLLQKKLPWTKVYIGKNREKLADLAVKEGAEVILLDDGFQYRKLKRDLDIVLLSSEDPFGKGHFLPWGFLRDDPKRLFEADFIFKQKEDLQTQVTGVLDLKKEPLPDHLRKCKVACFCGIAHPKNFVDTVERLGFSIAMQLHLADHAVIRPHKIEQFAQAAHKKGAKLLFCTEKDAIKLSSDAIFSLPLYYVEVETKISDSCREWNLLLKKIQDLLEKRR